MIGDEIIDRARGALAILRGTHKAVPVEATWYVVSEIAYPPGFYVYTNTPGTTSGLNIQYGGSTQ